MKDNISTLYGALKNKGYTDIGKDETEFRNWLNQEGNVKTLYGALSQQGFDDIGDEQQFTDWVGVKKQPKSDDDAVFEANAERFRNGQPTERVTTQSMIDAHPELGLGEKSYQYKPDIPNLPTLEQHAYPDKTKDGKFNIGKPGFVQDEATALYPMSQTSLNERLSDPYIFNKDMSLRAVDEAKEEEEIDKFYVSKPMNTAKDVYDNFSSRFTNTKRGIELGEELAKINKDIQDKYVSEYLASDDYKALASMYKGEDLSKRANEQFGLLYGDAFNKELMPYRKAYNEELHRRYGKQMDKELNRINKEEAGAHARELMTSVDSELEDVENRIAARAKAVRNLDWKPGMPSSRDDKKLAELRGERAYLEGAKELIDDSQKILNAVEAEKDGNFFGGLGRGVRDSVFDIDTWTMGLSDLVGGIRLRTVLEKAERGENLTSAEERLLDASVNNIAVNFYYRNDLGRGYQAGEITGQSIPFMLEFIVNPVSASGNAIAKSLLNYGMKRFAVGAIGKNAAKVGTRLVGDAIAAGGVTATSGLGNVMSGTVERLNRNYEYGLDEEGNLKVTNTNKIGLGEAFAKSATTAFLERQSEMIFNAFRGAPSLFKGVEASLPGGVNTFMNYLSNSRVGELWRGIKNNTTMRELAQRAQFHGIGEEYLEEVYNNFANIPLGEMTFEEATDLEKNIVTFLGLAPTQLMFGALGGISYGVERYKARRDMERTFGRMTEEQKRKLMELQELGRLESNKDIAIFLAETIKDESLTPKQKRAEIEYAYNLAKQNAIDEMSNTDIEDSIESENKQIDAATDPQTGMYGEVNLTSQDLDGNAVVTTANVFGEKEVNGELYLLVQAEGEEEKKWVRPSQYDAASYDKRPAEEVKALNEEMIREESAAQAELESKYAPEVLSAQMQQGVPFNTPTSQIVPVSPMPEGNGWIVEEYAMDENGKPSKNVNVRELTNDEYRDMLQDEIDRRDMQKPETEEPKQRGTVATPVALAYLLEGGQGSIENLGYFLHGVAAAFPELENEIEYIRGNIGERLGVSPDRFAEVAPREMAEMRRVIEEKYGREGVSIFDELVANSTGYVPRVGAEMAIRIESLESIQPSESVGEQVNTEVNNPMSPMEFQESTPTSPISTPMTENVKPQAPVIPTKEDGSIDFVSYGKEGSFKILGERYGEKMPNKVAVTAKALAEDLKKAQNKLQKAEEVYDNAPIGREQKAEEARDKAQQELEAIQREAEFWADMDADIKAAQLRRSEILNPEVQTESSNEPMTADEFVAQQLAAGNIILDKEDYKRETGYGDEEVKTMNGGNKKLLVNGGMSIQAAGERLEEIDRENGTNFFSEGDVNAGRDALLDLLGSVKIRKELNQYIANNRAEQAKRDSEGLRSEAEKAVMNANFSSLEDFVLQMEADEMGNPFADVDLNRIDTIFAEAEEEYQNFINNEQGRTSEIDEGNDNVLSEEQSDNTGRTEGIEDEGNSDGNGEGTLQQNEEAHAGEEGKNERVGRKRPKGFGKPKKSTEELFSEEKDKFSNAVNNDYAEVLSKSNSVEEAITEFNRRAEEARKRANEWRNRKYKENKTVVTGMNPYSGADLYETTIGAANERRREANVRNALAEAEKYESYASTLAERTNYIQVKGLQHQEGETILQFAERVSEENRRRPLRKRANEWSKALGVKVTLLESIDDVDARTRVQIEEAHAEGSGVPGWVAPNGEVFFFMPDLHNMDDVDNTYIHEVVAHIGLPKLLGEERFNEFCAKVWEMMPQSRKDFYEKEYPGVKEIKNDTLRHRRAADEYIAYLAEKENLTPQEKTIWDNIVKLFRDMLDKALNGIIGKSKITNEDISNLIKASYANLKIGAEGNVSGEGTRFNAKRLSDRRQDKNRVNNTVDQALSLVYGKDIKEIRKERHEEEQKRKEDASEIYQSVLSGDFNDVTLQKINDYIDDATPLHPYGKRISQRLPQKLERGLHEGARTNAVDALFSRICESAVPASRRASEAGRREIEERKKEALKGWAIATNNWYTDLSDFADEADFIRQGTDSKVYLAKDGKHVIKVSFGKPEGKRFRPDIDTTALFNNVFRNTAYEIVGYGEFDGKFARILKQPFVDFADKTALNADEREEYMRTLGFEPINESKTAFSNGSIVAADLQKSNILKDAAGNISVIDADMKLHTKDVGGNYTYPPVEADLPEGTRFRMTNAEKEELRDSEETKALFYYAKKRFGRTFDLREAGYILPDGAMLDFSGRHEMKPGSDTSHLAGYRSVDHRYVSDLNYEPEDDGGEKTGFKTDMADFINRGAIRMDGNIGSINLTMKPTSKQKTILQRLIQRMDGDVWVDFGNGWDTEHSAEYSGVRPMRVLSDIDKYYDEGIKPEGNTRFRFIGERGARNLDKAEEATTRLDNLSVAREMESAEKDAKAIKMATGWERGADGKWRYEVKDRFNVGAIERFVRGAYGKTFGTKVPLERVLKEDDSLLTEYPQLKGMSVKFQRLGDLWGVYYPESNEIAINTNFIREEREISDRLERQKELVEQWKKPEESKKIMNMIKVLELNPEEVLKDAEEKLVGIEGELEFFKDQMMERLETTIIHEVQHAIQHIEGFENGASVKDKSPIKVAKQKEQRAFMEEQLAKHKSERESLLKKKEELNEKMSSWYESHENATAEEVSSDMDMQEWNRQYDNIEAELESADRKVSWDEKWIETINNAKTELGEEGYNKVAGEVEARNAARRSRVMNEDEMREYLASETEDVAREDQIFLQNAMEGGQTMFRISDKGRKIQNEVDKFTEKYNSVPVDIVESSMTDKELVNAFDNKFGIDDIRNFMKTSKTMGGYIRGLNKVIIFADRMKPERMEESLFHENIHALMYNENHTKLLAWFYEFAKDDEAFAKWREISENKEYELYERPEEFFAYVVSNGMVADDLEGVLKHLDGEMQNELKELLNKIGYDYDVRRRSIGQSDNGRTDEGTSEESVVSGDARKTAREQSERLGNLFGQVADMGLDGVLGNKEYTRLMVDIYKELPEDVRTSLADDALRHYGGSIAPAVSDYVNKKGKANLWDKIAGFVREALRKVGMDVNLNANDAKYILWRSRKPLDRNNLLDAAEDIDMRYRLKVGEFEDSLTRFRSIEEVNDDYNRRLDELDNDRNQKDRVLRLGKPGRFLNDGGVSGSEIEMEFDKFVRKSNDNYVNDHPFSAGDIKNLPKAINAPIAVFDSTNHKDKVILTELKKGDNNFIVVIKATQRRRKGGVVLEVNEISTLYPKNAKGIVKWINDGLITNVDKRKALDWLEALHTHRGTGLINQELDSATKIVESFENPKIEGENVRKNGGGTRFRVDVGNKLNIRDEYEATIKKGSYQAREAVQDNMLSLRRVQELIEKASGKKLRDFENAWMHENRLSSVVQSAIHEMERKYYKPMAEAVKKLMAAANLEQEQVADYLMLKHGIERNREMAVRKALTDSEGKIDRQKLEQWYQDKRNVRNRQATPHLDTWRKQQEELDYIALMYGADMSRDYSGLTSMFDTDDLADCTERAYNEVEALEDANPAETEALRKAIKAMTQNTLDESFGSGLMNKTVYEELSNDMYDYYIPLRGFEETTSDEVYAYMDNDRGAFNAPLVRAKGRSSKSDNPLAYLKSIAESGIMQVERNKMKQTFLNMVTNHPSDLVSVREGVWAIFNPATGEWEAASFPESKVPRNATPADVDAAYQQWEADMEQRAQQDPNVKKISEAADVPYRVIGNRMNQHQVIVKRLGKSYTLTINGNPRLAMALNGLTNPNNTSNDGKVSAYVQQKVDALNRNLSAWYTTRNPDFVASNFMRDTFYTNTIVRAKEGNNYANHFHAHYAKLLMPGRMISLFSKYENGTLDLSKPMERDFHEFMTNGGETGYSNLKDLEHIKKQIAKDLKGGRLEDVKGILDKLDLVNRAVENTARFAAYRTSRQQGRSVARSIFDAKEISVNFNKKGAGGTFFGATGQTWFGNLAAMVGAGGRSMYVFFNAAIQGTTNLLHVMKVNPAGTGAGLAAMFLMGAVLPMLLGGDDEKDYYDLPEHVRRNHLILPSVGDSWISIPLPIEYRIMYGMGELLTSWRTGHERGSNIGMKMLSLTGQALPLNFLEEGVDAFVPSALSPLWQVYNNQSWTGLPIYKYNEFNKDNPEYTKAYKNVNRGLYKFTKALYRWTFDEENQEAGINLNPAVIEHIAKGYFGGLVTTLDNVWKTGEMVLSDREFDWRNIPVGNRIFKTGDERTKEKRIQNEYFENVDKLEFMQSRERLLRKTKDGAGVPEADKLEADEDYKILIGSDVYKKYVTDPNGFKAKKKEADKLYRQRKEQGDSEKIERDYYKALEEANKAVR